MKRLEEYSIAEVPCERIIVTQCSVRVCQLVL